MTRVPDPDWVANTRQMVRDRRSVKSRDKLGTALNMLLHPDLSRLLNHAAGKRRMNRSAYTRRALAIHIAHDLDLPVWSVLDLCPMPVSWAGRQMFANNQGVIAAPMTDGGEDLPTWCPHPGCDGKHYELPMGRTLFEEHL